MPIDSQPPPPKRRIYCNRTLNLRSMRAVGFDMDYTLIHYRVEVWERHAYDHAKARLVERGWPVADLEFDPDFATLGLIVDIELGNIVKANRFGYIKKACHGTTELPFDLQRDTYSRTHIDLADPRWRFMNTLFALSEAHLFAQCVDLLDKGALDDVGEGPMGYLDVYKAVRNAIDEAHMMGELKDEIVAQPDRFVELDADVAMTLMDIRNSGKKVVLITNSEWFYTRAMMSYAFDRFVPSGTWKDLFDLILVSARKPDFFASQSPVFEIVDEEQGHLAPVTGNRIREGGLYVGGSATLVERLFELRGEDVLYVGDHIFSDVNVSKKLHRWRTALVVRELEEDIDALEAFKPQQRQLSEYMEQKEALEHRFSVCRLAAQRLEKGYGEQVETPLKDLREQMQQLRSQLVELDGRIAPLAKAASQMASQRWGPIMRAGNDKSHLARQIERSADVYTSRVSNFLVQTPFVYLRSPRGSLPHDHGPSGGV